MAAHSFTYGVVLKIGFSFHSHYRSFVDLSMECIKYGVLYAVLMTIVIQFQWWYDKIVVFCKHITAENIVNVNLSLLLWWDGYIQVIEL